MANKTFFCAFFCFLFCLAEIMPPLFAAKNYDIKQMTPAIQQALANRKARYPELQRLKAEGSLGENREGFITALNSSSGADGLASAENSDRQVIYQAIVDQNGLGAGGLAQVKIVFAEVQREKARAGDSIQLPNGSWTKK